MSLLISLSFQRDLELTRFIASSFLSAAGHGRRSSLGTTATSPSTRRRSLEMTMQKITEALDGSTDDSAQLEEIAEKLSSPSRSKVRRRPFFVFPFALPRLTAPLFHLHSLSTDSPSLKSSNSTPSHLPIHLRLLLEIETNRSPSLLSSIPLSISLLFFVTHPHTHTFLDLYLLHTSCFFVFSSWSRSLVSFRSLSLSLLLHVYLLA